MSNPGRNPRYFARDVLAIVAWSVFWVLVILGAVALVWEWHFIRPLLGL